MANFVTTVRLAQQLDESKARTAQLVVQLVAQQQLEEDAAAAAALANKRVAEQLQKALDVQAKMRSAVPYYLLQAESKLELPLQDVLSSQMLEDEEEAGED